MTALLLLLQLFTTAPMSHQKSTGDPDALRLGRLYTEWFYQGELERLWGRLSLDLQHLFGSRSGLAAFRQKVRRGAGDEREVLDEGLAPWLGSTIYNRTARFSGATPPIHVQWTIDSDGIVTAFSVRPAQAPAATEHMDYQTKTPLRLPFGEEWFVFWGGRTLAENYHAVANDQRFAYDFVIARSGSTHTAHARGNEDYFCFDAPILAPADGKVVGAAGNIPDNVPGELNEAFPLGNHVILDHGNGEYSFLVHLRYASVAVAVGSTVSAGATIGRCGNSGRSSEPHLHYHLQTTPNFGSGDGLPAQFLSYCAGDTLIPRGEPRRGQVVSPAKLDGVRRCPSHPV